MPQAGEVFDPADVPFLRARGFRDTVFPTASTWTTTEAVAYRWDNLTVKAGKIYTFVSTPLNIVPSVTGDAGAVRLRYKESGPAGTGDTLFAHMRMTQTSTTQSNTVPITGVYVPNADLTTFSVALSLVRVVSGGGSSGVRLWGSSAEPLHLWIREEDDPGISGTAF